MIKIRDKAIKRKYGSIRGFCKEENIGLGVYYGLKKKNSDSFHPQGKSFKAFKKLEGMGLIIEEEETAQCKS